MEMLKKSIVPPEHPQTNCQAHFYRQGYDFFFEDQKDYKIFETVWS